MGRHYGVENYGVEKQFGTLRSFREIRVFIKMDKLVLPESFQFYSSYWYEAKPIGCSYIL